uniref:Uncharacterized protein n=1 Tax=Anguilla anguilla TaxID=7936 RepID=A0A0E9WUQ8_ANGAN
MSSVSQFMQYFDAFMNSIPHKPFLSVWRKPHSPREAVYFGENLLLDLSQKKTVQQR